MNCPFCKEKITEISRLCANCGKPLLDFNYFDNMKKMEEKYGKLSIIHAPFLNYPNVSSVKLKKE